MRLEGKTIAFLGDSITEGHGVLDRENNRYDNRLKRICGLKEVYNHGIGGSRFAHQYKPSEKPRYDLSFCGRAYNLEHSADIIVVFGGTNDYGHGDAPIGEWGDTTPATFYGATYFLMSCLKTEYPDAKIVFMTPAHRTDDMYPAVHPDKLSDALPLESYVKIIKQTAKQLDVPVLDLMTDLGIDPNDPEDMKMYAPDGLHFNDVGHEKIAYVLKNFLEEL